MSLHTFSTNPSNNSGSGIAAWAQGVSNGLRTMGLIRLNGSHAAIVGGSFAGASDFSALVVGGSFNTSYAWEIWRFDDALHAAGYPVYIHVWYGTGASLATPTMWVSVGFDVNNAVTPTALAGQVFAQQMVGSNSSALTLFNCFVSGHTGRALIALFADGTSNYPLLIAVERLHNADGTDNNEGVYVFCAGSLAPTAQKHQVVMRPALGANAELLGFLAGVWPNSNVTAWGGDFHVTPVFPVRGRLLPPSRNIMCAKSGDVANGATISVNHYGAARTFFFSANAWASNFGSGASAGYLLRYE